MCVPNGAPQTRIASESQKKFRDAPSRGSRRSSTASARCGGCCSFARARYFAAEAADCPAQAECARTVATSCPGLTRPRRLEADACLLGNAFRSEKRQHPACRPDADTVSGPSGSWPRSVRWLPAYRNRASRTWRAAQHETPVVPNDRQGENSLNRKPLRNVPTRRT